jgi:predicted porin
VLDAQNRFACRPRRSRPKPKKQTPAAFSKTVFSTFIKDIFMKKTMIALAAFGAVAGAAHAQSNVTLYGLVDMYVGQESTKLSIGGTTASVKTAGLESGGLNGSRWGVRGSEDLGGGLKANFQLESSISADTGASTGFTRTSKVGLSGGFGSIDFGRQYTRMFNLLDTYDAQGTNNFSAAYNAVAAGVLGTSVRWDNSIVYSTPAMGGFSASAQYAFAENATASVTPGLAGVSSGRSLGLLAGYSTGPVSVQVAFETTKNGDPTAAAVANAPSTKTTGLGASYDFGMLKAYAQFMNQKDGVVNGVRENAYVLGVSVPMGAGTFNAGYGSEQQKTAGVKSGKASSIGVEYRYDLSKRTTVYAALGHVKETAQPTTTDTFKFQNYGIGLRHKF